MARRLDEGQDDADERKAAGTPRYMAPEQLLSHWRDFGPWTDLYALGCLAWQLCTGETPFQSMRDFRQLLRAHLHMAPPAFKPIFKVPKSFEVWLRTLLAKRRTDRFPFAADALSALPAIDAGDQQARLVNLGPDDETEILDKTVPDLPSAASLDLKTEKTLLSDQTAPSIEIERVPGGLESPTSGLIDLDRVRLLVEPEREWAQMLVEAWRLFRDEAALDPDHAAGIDWTGCLRRHAALLARVACRS